MNVNDMTAQEMAEKAKRNKPENRYAYTEKGDAVAIWEGKWRVIAATTIFDIWANVPVPFLVNGEPAWKNAKFIEV